MTNIHRSPSPIGLSRGERSYALLGVDTEQALQTLTTVAISLHCWQGDDVGGFEDFDGGLSGGIAATGNYPGKARTPMTCAAISTRCIACCRGNIA